MKTDLQKIKDFILDVQTAAENNECLPLNIADVLKEIERLQALTLGGVSNWVAVKDRLPHDDYGAYIVCLENKSIFKMNYLKLTKRWWVDGLGEEQKGNKVVYWMELPKPPCC